MKDTEMSDYLNNNLEYQKKLVKYLIQCILSEGSKIVIFAFIFYGLHLFKEYVTSLFLLILLRTNGGGIHFQHYTSCFAVSFLMLLGSILSAIYIHLAYPIMTIGTLLCLVTGYLLVPITSTNRPPASSAAIKRSKLCTSLIIFVSFLLICRFPETLYIKVIFWTILLHIIQLLAAKILAKGGGGK